MSKGIRFNMAKSRWPTDLEEWIKTERPGLFSVNTLRDLRQYGTANIPSVVDPWYMGPLLANEYQDKNKIAKPGKATLRFFKPSINELEFMCGQIIADHKQHYISDSIEYQQDNPILRLDHLVSKVIGSEQRLAQTVINAMKMAGVQNVVFGEFYNRLYTSTKNLFEESGLSSSTTY